MQLINLMTPVVERWPMPDGLARAGIGSLVRRLSASLTAKGQQVRAFAGALSKLPIARHAQAANGQHYELPAEFFGLFLGPQRKYSCCLYETGSENLAEAETAAIEATMRNARLGDGQDILELGCGWGSLSLAMAQRFPGARIVAVSNSANQKRYIDGRSAALGLTNLSVVTADMNAYAPAGRFDRIVSVEMFEHMANWPALLKRVRTWLQDDGHLFVHVFSHATTPYHFDHGDGSALRCLLLHRVGTATIRPQPPHFEASGWNDEEEEQGYCQRGEAKPQQGALSRRPKRAVRTLICPLSCCAFPRVAGSSLRRLTGIHDHDLTHILAELWRSLPNGRLFRFAEFADVGH